MQLIAFCLVGLSGGVQTQANPIEHIERELEKIIDPEVNKIVDGVCSGADQAIGKIFDVDAIRGKIEDIRDKGMDGVIGRAEEKLAPLIPIVKQEAFKRLDKEIEQIKNKVISDVMAHLEKRKKEVYAFANEKMRGAEDELVAHIETRLDAVLTLVSSKSTFGEEKRQNFKASLPKTDITHYNYGSSSSLILKTNLHDDIRRAMKGPLDGLRATANNLFDSLVKRNIDFFKKKAEEAQKTIWDATTEAENVALASVDQLKDELIDQLFEKIKNHEAVKSRIDEMVNTNKNKIISTIDEKVEESKKMITSKVAELVAQTKKMIDTKIGGFAG